VPICALNTRGLKGDEQRKGRERRGYREEDAASTIRFGLGRTRGGGLRNNTRHNFAKINGNQGIAAKALIMEKEGTEKSPAIEKLKGLGKVCSRVHLQRRTSRKEMSRARDFGAEGQKKGQVV